MALRTLWNSDVSPREAVNIFQIWQNSSIVISKPILIFSDTVQKFGEIVKEIELRQEMMQHPYKL